MPRGSAYPGSPDALDAYRAIVKRHSDAEVLGAKNPYTSLNGWMTSFLDPDGFICLRMRAEDREAVIATGGATVKQYGSNMPDFVSAPDGSREAELDHLFSTSWDYAASLKPK